MAPRAVHPSLGSRTPPTGAEAGAIVAELRDLNVVYDGREQPLHAVRDVNLEVRRGEIIALVGESGSGKSSISMALLGLIPASEATINGHATVLGVDMATAPAAERRAVRKTAIGAVFQDPMSSLNPTMTIGRQLLEVAESPKRASELLEAVGVPDAKLRLRSYPHELSGGQRQRVMIAMSIARDPALVVADEPTTALDVTIQAQILALIRRLREQLGCAFLLITHDLGVAAQVADRIAVCYAGRVVEIGPTASILTRPRHPYAMALLRSRIELDADDSRQLPTLRGEPPDPRSLPPGCAFAPRCDFAADRCREVIPPLVPATSPDHLDACIRSSDLASRAGEDMTGRETSPRAISALVERAETSEPVLRLEQLEKSFTVRGSKWREKWTLQALRGVDLEVGPRECVAIVGESGCGKSTLLRVVAGLLEPDGGTLSQSLPGRPQMVFQDAGASLTPWLTVGEQIRERAAAAGTPKNQRNAAVNTALEHVGLSTSIARRKPSQLSGGQRQRVALARAIVIPPPILLCDEPTSSLDVSLAATVLNLIDQLRGELGMAAMFVTHDLAAARYVSDRIAVMYLGQIVEIGDSNSVASSPVHPYTKALLSAVTSLARKEDRALGDLPSPLAPPPGCPYHPRCAEALEACSHQPQNLRPIPGAEGRQAACIHVEGAP